MSAIRLSVLRKALAVTFVVAGMVVTLPAVAQAPKNDLQDKVRKEQEIAAQKVERIVADALNEAKRQVVKSPRDAVATLNAALRQVEADNSMAEDRRAALADMLKRRITLYGNAVDQPDPRMTPGDPRRGQDEARAAEDRAIQKTLQLIAQLRKDGRYVEAARAATDLALRYPTNPAARAAATTTGRTESVATDREIKGQSNFRFNGAMVSVDRSKLPPLGDIEFPKDWATKMKNRKGLNTPLLTAKEQAILKSLNSLVPALNYDQTSFQDVIEDLATKLGQTIVLDREALNAVNVTTDTPISLKLRGVTGRTALRKVLGDLGLTYVIKNEVIQVMTPEKARETMVTRTYYLGDLLAGGMFNDAGIRFVPGLDQIQAMQNVVNIIGLIQSSIEPQSWQANGGPGTITFSGPQMAIIIRQSAEVHGMLGGMFK